MASAPNALQILAQFQKSFGQDIGQVGMSYLDVPRLPFGIFPVDLALGGGIPMSKLSILFGPESSNKTNMVLRLMRMAQLIYPDKKCVMVDAEHALEPTWATRMGVDLSRLIYLQPEYAEQAVDLVEGFLYAPDVSMVALDSIAALITNNEVQSSAEKAVVGGNSNVVGRLIRKAIHALGAARRASVDGVSPPLVCVNQIRTKIGVMFGDPETTPGGWAPRFASACTLRVYGKNELDKKINPAMPAFKTVNVVIRKWKMPILQVNAMYRMQMLDFGGYGPGHVEDYATLVAYMKEYGYLAKAANGWALGEDIFPTLSDIRGYLEANPTILQEYKDVLIEEALQSHAQGPSDGLAEAGAEIDADAAAAELAAA